MKQKIVTLCERHFQNNHVYATAYLSPSSLKAFQENAIVIVHVRVDKHYENSYGSWRLAKVDEEDTILEEGKRYYYKATLLKVG